MEKNKYRRDYSVSYRNYIARDYCNAVGIDLDTINTYSYSNDKEFVRDLAMFLSIRRDIGKKYLKILKKLNLSPDFKKRLKAEVGKGPMDSILSNDKNSVAITPYHTDPKLIPSRLVITEKGICFFKNLVDKSLIPITTTVDTFLTQNPYNEEVIKDWEFIPQTKSGKIIVGAYGKTYDKDYDQKIRALREFKSRVNNAISEHTIIGDNYFYFVTNKEEPKQLVKEK